MIINSVNRDENEINIKLLFVFNVKTLNCSTITLFLVYFEYEPKKTIQIFFLFFFSSDYLV